MNHYGMEYSHNNENVIAAENSLMRQVYAWMGLGLTLTALAAFFTISTPELFKALGTNKTLFWSLIISQFGLVIALSAAINKLSNTAATLLFLGYSILNGITLSVIFLLYTADSIGSTFMISAGMFFAMSAYGYMTKRDLTSWGSFLYMGLTGVFIAFIVNFFLKSGPVAWITSAIGVIVFIGLTAYDTQKIKTLAAQGVQGRKPAIIGALALYLDFINLFLMLLRLLGNRR